MPGAVNNASGHLFISPDLADFNYFGGILEEISVLDPFSEDKHMDFVWVSVLSLLRISRQLIGNYN